jgi:hypothetical protein
MDHPRGEMVQEARATGREAAPQYTAGADDGVGAFPATQAWDADGEPKQMDLEKVEGEYEPELENSPYPEVQAAVDNWDDVTVPANTLRAWFLGMFFVTIGSGVNLFFSLRDPNITVGPLVVQLCAYPVGKFMAMVLPKKVFNLMGLKFSLNPGPFNKKEHALITIMANVSFGTGKCLGGGRAID